MSNKTPLRLDLENRYNSAGRAAIHAIDDPLAETHYAVAQVVVRMEGDEQDDPALVMFANAMVDRYNQHNELTEHRDALLAALQGMIDIANDSQGVAGYHLNGEVADWGEFEEWQAACDAIAKAKGGAS